MLAALDDDRRPVLRPDLPGGPRAVVAGAGRAGRRRGLRRDDRRQGNGTALVAAYALAGELAAAGGDHTGGLPAIRGPGRRRSPGAPSGAATPPAASWPRARAHGLAIRNYLHNQQWFMPTTYRIAAGRSTGIDLPDYESLVSAAFRSPPRSARRALSITRSARARASAAGG